MQYTFPYCFKTFADLLRGKRFSVVTVFVLFFFLWDFEVFCLGEALVDSFMGVLFLPFTDFLDIFQLTQKSSSKREFSLVIGDFEVFGCVEGEALFDKFRGSSFVPFPSLLFERFFRCEGGALISCYFVFSLGFLKLSDEGEALFDNFIRVCSFFFLIV